MDSRLRAPLLPLERIASVLQLEAGLMIAGLAVAAWLVFRLFLGGASDDRKRALEQQFRSIFTKLALASVLLVLYLKLQALVGVVPYASRLASYVGLATIVLGAIVFVRTCRILISEYLFLGSMGQAVPVLLINLFTLALSLAIGAWIATDVFAVRLGPLLATSTILSLILGLALQDTLGGLFAGIALQLDKPYELGDWIELAPTPQQKLSGKVVEISWRMTTLVSASDEVILIPNRIMANSQIANFGAGQRAFTRTLLMRIDHQAPIEEAREAILAGIKDHPALDANDPAPLALVHEVGESAIVLKLVYSIRDYARQSIIAGELNQLALAALQSRQIAVATPKLRIATTRLESVSQID